MPAPPEVSSWRDQVRDPALTAMLCVQCLIIFVAGPFTAAGYPGARLVMDLTAAVFAVLVVLASRGRIATAIAAAALLLTLAGLAVNSLDPTPTTLILAHVGSIGSFGVVGYVVGSAVFAPGTISGHRIRGAIVLYLNFGMIIATGYRALWDLIPGSLSGIPSGADSWQAAGAILYFSFVTLTTIGYGDLAPIHPLARGLANLEGIIGQLYPATILARLITLQLDSRR